MAVFSLSDFSNYVAIPEDELDEPRVNMLAREALVLIQSVVPSVADMDEYPDTVTVVALRAVKRAYVRDGLDGAASQQTSAGPFSQTVAWSESASSGGVWLSKADKHMLRTSLAEGKGRAYTVNLMPSYASGAGVGAPSNSFLVA